MMDAILLCMKKKGIYFFRKIQFPNTDVIRFHTKENFLGLLRSRYDNYDNVLIMAHGGNHAILTTTTELCNPYITYIKEEDTDVMKNDFVFAVSCLTANGFGKRCVENGCIAYLGYQVEISRLFSSAPSPKNSTPDTVITAVNTLVKHIFVKELSVAYEEFLRTPISVQVLRERFAFALEKKLAELSNMTPEQVFAIYSIRIKKKHFQAYAVNLILDVLSFLNDVLPRLICIGDENYISSSFIRYRKADGFSSAQISAELISNPFFQRLAHTEYKNYLRDYAASI